jgi:hypothetical protein
MARWLPLKAGQQPTVPRPTLQHVSGQKKLTAQIILDTDICAEVSNTLRWQRSARERLGSASGCSLLACRRFAAPGRSRFHSRHQLATAGGHSLRASSRPLRLAHGVDHPDDRPALLRSILTVLVHHCRHNSSNIPSVRKHSQVTSHARRKEVFASRAV